MFSPVQQSRLKIVPGQEPAKICNDQRARELQSHINEKSILIIIINHIVRLVYIIILLCTHQYQYLVGQDKIGKLPLKKDKQRMEVQKNYFLSFFYYQHTTKKGKKTELLFSGRNKKDLNCGVIDKLWHLQMEISINNNYY